MNRNVSSVSVCVRLIQNLFSPEIGWDRGLLGEKLADEILPFLSDEPALVLFLGDEPCFFSHGFSDHVADKMRGHLLSFYGRKGFSQLFHDDDRPFSPVPISEIIPDDSQLRLRFSDGIFLFPLKGRDEEVSGLIGVMAGREAAGSEKLHAMPLIALVAGSILSSADEINSLESFLQLTYQIVENDPSGIAICNPDGRVIRANRAMAELTGVLQEELADRAISRFFQPNVYSELRERWRLDKADSYEVFIFNRSGDRVPVRLSPYRIRLKEKVWHVIQLEDLREMYELKQKEMEVERLQAVFHAAVTVQDKVNTPLTIILAHLERLRLKWQSGLTKEDLDKSLEVVERQVDKITKTLSRMGELKHYRVQDYALNNRMMLDISDSTDMEQSHSASRDGDDKERK
ncbi:MAG: PAS domain S-box protein [Acidobacteria bacterium]|nr:PAS domain S-box protein [Acidobacteriota bacterium]